MKKNIEYKIFKHGNEIIAMSTFARHPVKGIAKCSPNDEYSEKIGTELAIVRCANKIAKKRLNWATKLLGIRVAELKEAGDRYGWASKYYNSAENEVAETSKLLKDITESI